MPFFKDTRAAAMSRVRTRVCLQEGPHLNLNWLARNGFITKGMKSPERGIRWTHPDLGDVARGSIRADMRDARGAWLRVRVGESSQLIALASESRKFGGWQWYFVCP